MSCGWTVYATHEPSIGRLCRGEKPNDERSCRSRKRNFGIRQSARLIRRQADAFRTGQPVDPDSADSSRWFVTEVQPHRAALRAWLLARFPTLPDVEDLVQETFARVLRARDAGPIRSTRALLFATARNLALDAVRRQRVVSFEPVTDDTDPSVLTDSADVISTVNKQQELELLTRAIQSLPERCRQILTLRTAYGLTQKQIAARLGVSESTVEKQTAVGIRLCAEFFASRGAR